MFYTCLFLLSISVSSIIWIFYKNQWLWQWLRAAAAGLQLLEQRGPPNVPVKHMSMSHNAGDMLIKSPLQGTYRETSAFLLH